MDHAMDPYEQQLLSVFNSYDISHRGSLDQEGLLQLCNSLQLEEQGVELVKCLLSDSKSHVTFIEFKEGLLALLGNVQSSRQKLDFDESDESENESPDREISPKFVYGSKRYGRRSRPESTEQIELFDHPDADLENNSEVFVVEKYENKPLKNVNKVQRSNSQSDVTHSRKRKTSGKLKRCTSFPGNHEMKCWNNQDKQSKETKIQSQNSEYCSSMLQSALEQLGIGSDGFLSHLEIIRICEFMGMHKLAKDLLLQLPNKPDTDLNRRVTVDEFLEVLQKHDCIYEVSSTISLNSSLNNTLLTEDFGTKSLQYITLGPNGSGVISSQAIVELWENAGIPSAATFLQELGFTESNIGIVDLATILDDELRSLNETRADISYTNMNPHIILLQASIALYQSEVKYLKSVLEQLSAERDKLRTDISDANQRASLLAQEVDDNHAKMERNTQNQVRLLEQRHSDMIKELTSQFVGEKEHVANLNNKLEEKIFSLEIEEAKLRSDLQAIQKYNNSLEKENHLLTNQVSELENQRTSLSEKVNLLENECQKISDIERERDQLEPLLKKLSILQIENAELRDKNDELCTEVESLNSEISAMRVKVFNTPTNNISNAEENVSNICEGVGLGLGAIKRRVDSPCKDNANECGLETETPRSGKVRRYYKKNQLGEVLLEALGNHSSFNASESGLEQDLEYPDSSLSFTGSDHCNTEEVAQLQARISYLEQVLMQHSIKIPINYISNNSNNKNVGDCTNDDLIKSQLMKRCQELELILEEVQLSVTSMISKKSECKDTCDLLYPMSELSDKLKGIAIESSSDESLNSSATTVFSVLYKPNKVDSSVETNETYLNIKQSLDEKDKQYRELLERCEDLEQALDLLRTEFENCENYWSNKLDEERQLFEQEHKQSSDKLSELFIKISEYEEQFSAQDVDATDGRLSPIEEKGTLEQQFVDLEEEYEEFRSNMEAELKQRDIKIAILQEKLNEQIHKNRCDTSIQVDLSEHIVETKVSNLSNVIQSTNIFSSETLPHAWQYPSNLQPVPNNLDSIESSVIQPSNLSNIPERDYINQSFIWNQTQMEENDQPIIVETNSTTSTAENSMSSIKSEYQTCYSLPPNISGQPPRAIPSPQPHSINYIPDHSTFPLSQSNSNNSCRPKRTRKHDRNIFAVPSLRPQKKEHEMFLQKHSDYEQQNGHVRWNSFGMHNGSDTCIIPLNSIHHLHGRLRELDQHCRHLQLILKQQQRHSEGIMHHCWQQHRDEVNELQMQMKSLQEKLARSDMLIKDLYVENTYLMANNQRLEHRCHMLVQCSSESTSV